ELGHDLQRRLGAFLHVARGDARRHFAEHEPIRSHVDARDLRNDAMHDGAPSFAACSMITTTRFALATRSIAPPIPFTILPGIIQFARSPFSLTCIAP